MNPSFLQCSQCYWTIFHWLQFFFPFFWWIRHCCIEPVGFIFHVHENNLLCLLIFDSWIPPPRDDHLVVKSGTTKKLWVFKVLGDFEERSIPIRLTLNTHPLPRSQSSQPAPFSAPSHCGFVLIFHFRFLHFSLRRKKSKFAYFYPWNDIAAPHREDLGRDRGALGSSRTCGPSFVTPGEILNTPCSASSCIKWRWHCLS